MRVIFRGFQNGKLIFEDPTELSEGDLDGVLPALAEEHIAKFASPEGLMIEVEFPDDPPDERFFRLGTTPRGMRDPIAIDLKDLA